MAINSIDINTLPLTETTSEFYTFGIYNGQSRKINLSFVTEDYDRLIYNIRRPPMFDETQSYQIGDHVSHLDSDEKIRSYVFIIPHVRESWNTSHVILRNDYYYTLNERELYDDVSVHVKSPDVNFNKGGKLVVAKTLDGLLSVRGHTDVNGICTLKLNKKLKWAIILDDAYGYIRCPYAVGYDASTYHYSKDIDVYYYQSVDTCQITVDMKTSDGLSTKTSSKAFAALFPDCHRSVTGTTDANGCCTLTVPKNQLANFYFPYLSTISVPQTITMEVITDRDKTISVVYPI